MKKIILVIFAILIGFLLLKIFTMTPPGWKGDLINPMGQKSQSFDTISTPVPAPNAPKSFQFDSSTDLKAELEKVDPQILDSDFE